MEKTQYEYATLGAFDENGNSVSGTIIVTDITWHDWFAENSGLGYEAVGNRVLVGRKHNGDEKGKTCYATAIIKFNGQETTTINRTTSDSVKESSGTWCCSDAKSVMTGRHHSGDENGKTYYHFAEVCVTVASTEPAPEGTIIVPNARINSETIKESAGEFLCPSNCVLTGRMHTGDENGNTTYQYASLKAVSADGKAVDGDITVENITWTSGAKESDGGNFDAPFGKVIVGRAHSGDENGNTRYAVGEVFFNGHPTIIKDYHGSAPLKENAGTWFKTDDKSVMTARHHYGDENGTTYYGYGIISCDAEKASDEPIILHVMMHSEDNCFPMDPQDYVRLSRVRRHVDGGTDYGYSKTKGDFVKGNDKTAEYYDIPQGKMKEFRPDEQHALMSLRPYDSNSVGSGELFLQPDNHVLGDSKPNKRVPTIKFACDNKTFQYWLFFGYDKPSALGVEAYSHQGDWECITVVLDDNRKIKEVTLSVHSTSNTYQASELEIVHGEKDELTVYCAKGTHALYKNAGTQHYKASDSIGIEFNDYTDAKGYKWTITDKVVDLNDESLLWKYFAGAWGEIGEFSFTTGPLGPWYKCDGLDREIQGHNSPYIPSLISENQLLLKYDTERDMPSVDIAHENVSVAQAPTNMMLYLRTHSGDENGSTRYQYAYLKAVKQNGEKVDATIVIEDILWSDWHKQSESANFFVPTNLDNADKESRVIIGRQHKGDENGETRYLTGVVKCNGKKAKVIPYPNADLVIYESQGKKAYPKENLVMYGIKHSGDENGRSTYCQAYIVVEP